MFKKILSLSFTIVLVTSCASTSPPVMTGESVINGDQEELAARLYKLSEKCIAKQPPKWLSDGREIFIQNLVDQRGSVVSATAAGAGLGIEEPHLEIVVKGLVNGKSRVTILEAPGHNKTRLVKSWLVGNSGCVSRK